MRNVWQLPYTPAREKKFGKNPTQKPEALLERLVTIGTRENDVILDCFAGTGTTGVVAERLGRRWVMIEKESVYADIAKQRITELREAGSRNMTQAIQTVPAGRRIPRAQLLEQKSVYCME